MPEQKKVFINKSSKRFFKIVSCFQRKYERKRRKNTEHFTYFLCV